MKTTSLNTTAPRATTTRFLNAIGTSALALVITTVLGCGGGKGTQPKNDFFTSGSREADQRATQRMAKEEQLSGAGEGSGEKDVKKAKVGEDGVKPAQAESKLTLFDRLGGEQGIGSIVDDFMARAVE